jgi:two-component system, chemotaxis family, chemotaxis protein CheY
MQVHQSPEIASLLTSLRVLIIEDNSFTRRINRALLAHVGIKTIYEAVDGISGLEGIRKYAPDLVVVDWDLPLLTGAELVRMVRSPSTFPLPDVPIIVLTCHGERWRVIEAQRCGANEFLVKPASAQAMLDRIVSIFKNPRPMVQLRNYYGPQPRGAFVQFLRHQKELGAELPIKPAPSPTAAPAPLAKLAAPVPSPA